MNNAKDNCILMVELLKEGSGKVKMVHWDFGKGNNYNGFGRKDSGIMGSRVRIDMESEDSSNHSRGKKITRTGNFQL